MHLQTFNTVRDFSNSLNASSQVDAILLDFSKAFDKVDHSILLSKMSEIGIQGPLLSWSASFLQGRTQRVLVDGSVSDPCLVQSGVPQGTVLGPLFFCSTSTTSKGTFPLALTFVCLLMTVSYTEQ